MTSPPVVTTTMGKLRGTWVVGDGGDAGEGREPVAVFLGIPYAAAPVGPARFRDPAPHPFTQYNLQWQLYFF